MSDLTIILTETLRADYRQLPDDIQKKFDKQLRFLAENPRHPSLNIHRTSIVWLTTGNFMWTFTAAAFSNRPEKFTRSSMSGNMKL